MRHLLVGAEGHCDTCCAQSSNQSPGVHRTWARFGQTFTESGWSKPPDQARCRRRISPNTRANDWDDCSGVETQACENAVEQDDTNEPQPDHSSWESVAEGEAERKKHDPKSIPKDMTDITPAKSRRNEN